MPAGHKSGEYSPAAMEHGPRIAVLERTVSEHAEAIEEHDDKLNEGRGIFIAIQKDLQSLTEKVSGLTSAAYWLIGVMTLGVLGTAGAALLWVISHGGIK